MNLIDVPNCSYLFESHVGVVSSSETVTSWVDNQSGSGLTAAGAARYKSANAEFGLYPTLDWEVSDVGYLESGALAAPVVPPITYLSVMKCPNVATFRCIFRDRFSTGPGQPVANLDILPTAKVRWTGTATPLLDSATPIALTAPVVLIVTQDDSGNGAIYANGSLIGSGAKGPGGFNGVRIGSSFVSSAGPAGVFPFVGSMAVVGAWARVYTADEIAAVTALLRARYQF